MFKNLMVIFLSGQAEKYHQGMHKKTKLQRVYNVMCQLAGTVGYPDIWLNILGVPVKVFQDEINI